MTSKSKVKGIDNNQFRNDRSVDIIGGSVNEVATREGVGRGHFGAWEDFPDDIKVLKDEGPASLTLR